MLELKLVIFTTAIAGIRRYGVINGGGKGMAFFPVFFVAPRSQALSVDFTV